MKLNKAGIDLIKKYEGCRLEAYMCSAGVWTVGWGNTRYEDGTRVQQGDVITQERADELFKNLLRIFVLEVRKLLTSPVSENKFSALVSFTWNLGIGALKGSTLLKYVNDKNYNAAVGEFPKWKYVGGKVLKGLVKRRAEEALLFMQ